MQFIHAADIHLDSPLLGLGRRDENLAGLVESCTRRAFENMIDHAVASAVDFILIAGDLYDLAPRDFRSILYVHEQVRRARCPVLLIHGNHDSIADQNKHLVPPENLVLFPGHTPDSWVPDHLPVAVHGMSYPDRAVSQDLTALYPDPVPGRFNIGLLHSSVESPGAHATYAPCRVEALVNKGYDYWALGHVHTRADLSPHIPIHFPGNTQGRHVNETGPRGVTHVIVQGGAVASATFHATDVVRWARLHVPLDGADTWSELDARLRTHLVTARAEADGRPLIVRVILEGVTSLHPALLANPDQTEAQVRDSAATIHHDLSIESVRLRTRAPSTADLAPLEASFRAALQQPDLVRDVLADLEPLRLLGAPDRQLDLPRTADDLALLLDDAWSLVRHTLTSEPDA